VRATRAMRSSSGPESLATYFATIASSQRHSPSRVPRIPHGQGRVALLQGVPLRLKTSKPKQWDLQPSSLGAHIRRRRLMLGMKQRDLASEFGVRTDTVRNWEKSRTEPTDAALPAIIRFLGYAPFPQPANISDRLRNLRRAMGWSIRKAASETGVDAGTWGDWERGKVILFRAHRIMVARLLGMSEGELDRTMAASWARAHK
jgi:transcriptional regulator with XRE-family HTH domain